MALINKKYDSNSTSADGRTAERVLAITGVSGYLGQMLTEKITADNGFGKIIGIDIKKPEINQEFKFYNLDIRDKNLSKIFSEENVTHVVHLAYVVNPTKRPKLEYDIDVNGTKKVLEACSNGKIRKLIIASSIAAYGWHQNNPIPITETDSLRGNDEFPYSKNKVIVENLVEDFQKNNPSCEVVVLRICNVIGPKVNNAISFALETPVFFGVSGFDPYLSFTYEDDMTEILYQSLTKNIRGVFNVSGNGKIKLSEMMAIANKKTISLPESILKFIFNILFWLKILPFGGRQIILMKYSCIPSVAKLIKEFGYTPRYSAAEAFKKFVAERLKK